MGETRGVLFFIRVRRTKGVPGKRIGPGGGKKKKEPSSEKPTGGRRRTGGGPGTEAEAEGGKAGLRKREKLGSGREGLPQVEKKALMVKGKIPHKGGVQTGP